MGEFSWASEPAKMLLNQLNEKLKVWDECRRWYKWLSLLPLLLAYCLLFASGLLFQLGVGLVMAGACCTCFGHSMGTTEWFDVDSSGRLSHSHTEDHGAICKILGQLGWIAGWSCIIASLVCYLMSWFFLASTFIWAYEEIHENAPKQYFVLKIAPNLPPEMKLFRSMNRKNASVGLVLRGQKVYGQHVYTGWIRTCPIEGLEGEQQWLYCNRRGAMIFECFDTEEAADAYIKTQIMSSPDIEANFTPSANASPANVEVPVVAAANIGNMGVADEAGKAPAGYSYPLSGGVQVHPEIVPVVSAVPLPV